MSKVYSLAFCFVLIGTVFADFKTCSDASQNKAFDGPDNNVLLKLFKESQLEDEELKQFMCDLSEHQIVIGAAFDDQAQGLPPPTIKPSLMEEFEFLKKIELVDKPAAELMHKLHKSISILMHSINEGIIVENSELKAIKSELVQTLRLLADRWQIPADEIVPTKNEKKMGQESLLRKLAKLWNEYKRQNWQNDQKSEKCNYGKGQHEKRMLQVMMDLSSDGSGGLADLKSAKKRQRRRKKRGDTQSYLAIGAVIVVSIVTTLALYLLVKKCTNSCGHGTSTSGGYNDGNELESGWSYGPNYRPEYTGRHHQPAYETGHGYGQQSGTMPYRGQQSMPYGGHPSSTYGHGHGGGRTTRLPNHRENRPPNYPNSQHLGQPPTPGRHIPPPPGHEEEDQYGCTIV